MPKHVYPPWHSAVQKSLFVVAVIICIALPVIHGEDGSVSSTAVIIVLPLYFAAWAVFSLAARFGIKSKTVESQLPVHTPTPAPPVRLYTPADRDAVPAAPAIKITPSLSRSPPEADIITGTKGRETRVTRFADDVKHVAGSKEGSAAQQPRPLRSPRFLDSPPLPLSPPTSTTTFGPPSPGGLGKGVSGNSVVTFHGQSYDPAGDSTNSDTYPTFATYRQSQRAKFDAFAQRIRRALDTANEQRQIKEETLERLRQQQEQQGASDYSEKAESSQDQSAEMEVRPVSDELAAASTSVASALSPSTLSVVQGGRPRSSSAASMMSNLSEKMRMGVDFIGRAGRSRAASDASLKGRPAPLISASGTRMNPSSASSSRPPAVVPTSELSSHSSTTTTAAIVSSAAVASAMSIPWSSANKPELDAGMEASYQAAAGDGRRSDVLPTSGKQSSPSHPLAETMHVKDDSNDNDPSLKTEEPSRPTDDNILLALDAYAEPTDDDKNRDISGRRRRSGDSSASDDIQVLVGNLETKNEL